MRPFRIVSPFFFSLIVTVCLLLPPCFVYFSESTPRLSFTAQDFSYCSRLSRMRMRYVLGKPGASRQPVLLPRFVSFLHQFLNIFVFPPGTSSYRSRLSCTCDYFVYLTVPLLLLSWQRRNGVTKAEGLVPAGFHQCSTAQFTRAQTGQ